MFQSSALTDWRPVLASAADRFKEGLSEGPLPLPLVEALLEQQRIECIKHLASNRDSVGDDLDLQARIAATGHPDVARAIVFGRPGLPDTNWWPLRGCREVLAAARPHEDWTIPGGVLAHLGLGRTRRRRALVVCPVGRSARTTLIDIAPELTRAEQLRGLLTVHDHDGGLMRLGHLNQNKFRPEVSEVLRTVLANGDTAALQEAVTLAEGSEGLIEELYENEARYDALELHLDMVGLRDRIDWDALRQAHADRPFGKYALKALATRSDCPEALRPPPPPAKILVKDETGLPALVAKHLGDNVGAWREARRRLPRFNGNIVDMLAEVGEAAKAPGSGKAAAQWPGAGELPAWDRVASVSGTRAKFVALLDAAAVETHLVLLRHLDDRTVGDLFGQGAWRAEWLDFAMKAKQKRYRLALAQRPSLTSEAVEVLMSRNDPAVNARLFLRTGATGPQRERLLSGRLSKDLVERLMERDGGFRARDAISCSSVRLQRRILSHVRVRGVTPQLRLLLNLWERGGPQAVRDLLDNEPKGVTFSRNVIRREVRKPVTKLLAQQDAVAALEELRATVAAGETAEAQIAGLRTQGTHPAAEVFREAHLWHWDEIIAEHRRRPFGPTVLIGLAEIPECPQEIRDEADRRRWRWIESTGSTVGGETAREILGGNSAGPWLSRAVRAGAVTWEEVVTLARPADAALAAMTGPEARAALAPLVRDHLDPVRESWVLALRMLPGFTGTVTELIHTAAAATAHQPQTAVGRREAGADSGRSPAR
ncbi:hypothetical protein ACQPZP_42505 [Spirillospora sp. CA-142024]|uniref:hypothetical protein n=1 Tax=Spirillospora sp. CA-142024 TaxID=3240036 RepID=UPI003D942AD9